MRVGQSESAVVIGAGIVGATCALRLQRLGLRTTLVDAHACPEGASYGNAGHIAIEQVEPLASWATIRSVPRRLFARGGALDVRDLRAVSPWMARFVRAASPARFKAGCTALRGLLERAMPEWRALMDGIGRRDLLLGDGHTVLWESPRSARQKRDAWMAADTGAATLRDLTAVELEEFSALLRVRPAGGIRFDGTGQVADPALALQALHDAFAAAGGVVRHARVRGLELDNDRSVAALEDGERLQADVVLVAAGVASKDLLRPLGIAAPLIAERGYHLQWPQHEWPARLSPVVFEDRSLIVTRFRSGLRAASFVEFAQPHTAPDPRKWAALEAHVAALGLPTRGPSQPWMGARPTLPDYLPAIGRSPAIPNLFYAFGHQHLGLTLAPVTACIVGDLVAGRAPAVPMAPFDLQRFHTNARAHA